MAYITKRKEPMAWEYKKAQDIRFKNKSWSKDADFYFTKKWRDLSKSVRQNEPFCRICMTKGLVKLAEVTDHIKAVRLGGDKYNLKNLQPLCRSCNNAKKT